MSNENQNSFKKFSHQQDGEKQTDTGTASASFQAIATAYGDYTKKSFEDTKAFVEKLSGVRSLDKAIEVQTEFAKTAYETFVTEFAENWRAVRRSCQAIPQAVWWPCRKVDPKSVRPKARNVRTKLPCSSRGTFLLS